MHRAWKWLGKVKQEREKARLGMERQRQEEGGGEEGKEGWKGREAGKWAAAAPSRALRVPELSSYGQGPH